jgi:hypothetical protein
MERQRRQRSGSGSGSSAPALTAGGLQQLLALRDTQAARLPGDAEHEPSTVLLTLQVLEVLETHTHGCNMRIVRLFDGAATLTACVQSSAPVAPLQLLTVQRAVCMDVMFQRWGPPAPLSAFRHGTLFFVSAACASAGNTPPRACALTRLRRR